MKYYGTELNKRRYEILMSADGVDALGGRASAQTAARGRRAWLRTKANSIEGGTSEVMLGIVAKRILDLPGAYGQTVIRHGRARPGHPRLTLMPQRRGCPAQGRA